MSAVLCGWARREFLKTSTAAVAGVALGPALLPAGARAASPVRMIGIQVGAVSGVDGRCCVYPGIGIDVPTAEGLKKTSPEDVYASTTAALGGGSDGVLYSRKYSEMRLANLAAAGRAVREWRGGG